MEIEKILTILYHKLNVGLEELMELNNVCRENALKEIVKEELKEDPTQYVKMIENARFVDIIIDFGFKILNDDIKRNEITKSVEYNAVCFLIKNMLENNYVFFKSNYLKIVSECEYIKNLIFDIANITDDQYILDGGKYYKILDKMYIN